MANTTIILAAADTAAQGHGADHAAAHAGTAMPSPELKNDFPPFDTQHYASQIIWLAIVFGTLYLLMSKIALPRIGAILETRAAKISGDLATAHKARAAADEAATAHDKQLSDARAKAQATAQETQAKLTAESDAKRKALEADLASKMAAAEQQIAATKTAAMGHVGAIAQETAGAIVEHLLGAPVDAAKIAAALSASKGA